MQSFDEMVAGFPQLAAKAESQWRKDKARPFGIGMDLDRVNEFARMARVDRAMHPTVYKTPEGETPYLRMPGVALLNQTTTGPAVHAAIAPYLKEFGEDFREGMDDYANRWGADHLAMFAGQLCYMAFEKGQRTECDDSVGYLRNLLLQGHGSVLEHVNVSFLVYGIPRTCSHEWVRHRAGAAYSQLSQRYVSGKTLRFTERREVSCDSEAHGGFLDDIDRAAEEYDRKTNALFDRIAGGTETIRERRELRKAVRQVARDVLPGNTETAMVVTKNVRAWRHFLDMRCSRFADTAIMEPAWQVFLILRSILPAFFQDYEVEPFVDAYGIMRWTVKSSFRKV